MNTSKIMNFFNFLKSFFEFVIHFFSARIFQIKLVSEQEKEDYDPYFFSDRQRSLASVVRRASDRLFWAGPDARER